MDCSLKKCASENKGILAYTLDVNRYYNNTPCRIEQGLVGGNNVSLYEGNLVDLDSEFRGLTRKVTKCPIGKYQPGTIIQDKDVVKCTDQKECSKQINGRLTHLPTCNIIKYKPKQNTSGYAMEASMATDANESQITGYSQGSNYSKY